MSERDELVAHLQHAHEHTQRRVFGRWIFLDAADQIERDKREIEKLRRICDAPFRAMELFWEADEAADEAKGRGDTTAAERYDAMATARWQSIPDLVARARAALNGEGEA